MIYLPLIFKMLNRGVGKVEGLVWEGEP